ncbi:MAG: VOC family protein [Saprospiraceae bacterium]|nr:VOC family protein [Saprospiraceae bacterium]MCB9324602.1 VOC family protein [Lewinellaceae bacterium]
MTTVNVYLSFNGHCEEAFLFYRSVFGGEFPYVGKYKDMPPREGMPPMPEALKEKIMHISLPVSKETILMGSDSGGEWSVPVQFGNNFSISVNTDDPVEAERIFNALAAGGTINMPLEKTFWQSYFGLLTDKFGINWMINCELKEHLQFEKTNKP